MSSIGPRDLISGAAAGADYGYGLIWALVLIGLARLILLEAMARYVAATGETLLAGYRKVGAWAAWAILASIVLKRYLSNLYHVMLLGASAGLLLGWESGAAAKAAAAAACLAAFWLMYGGYGGVEKWSKPLAALLAGSLLAITILSRPDLEAMMHALLSPSIPEHEGRFGPMLMILVLVGSGAGSISSLKYSAFVYEKGWRSASFLRRQRFDLLFSVAAGIAISALIQIAAAAASPPGAQLEGFDDLAAIFVGPLGSVGLAILAVGLWATVFTTYVGSNAGYSLLAADLIVRAPDSDAPAAELAFAGRRRAVYRLFLIAFCLPPMAVLITEWKPIPLVLIASALSALAVPLMVIILFLLTRDRKHMGDYVNGFWNNAALLSLVLLSLIVTWRAAVEFAARFL